MVFSPHGLNDGSGFEKDVLIAAEFDRQHVPWSPHVFNNDFFCSGVDGFLKTLCGIGGVEAEL